jgi:hypothetical protein
MSSYFIAPIVEGHGEVQAVTKAQGMAWPQYFDGKMWDNEISSRYGISQIPTMWLVDKKGMVTDTAAGDDLEGKVKKLLGGTENLTTDGH